MIVLMVFYAIFSDVLFYGIIIPLLPRLADKFSAGESAMKLFYSVYGLGLMAITPLLGWMSGKTGKRGLILLGGAMLIASTSLFLLAGNFATLLVARTLQGFSTAVNWTLGLALVSDYHEEKERGKALGICLSGMSLGILLGPVIGGVLGSRFDLIIPLLFVLALNLVDLALRFRFAYDIETNGTWGEKNKKPLKGSGRTQIIILMGLTALAVAYMSFVEPIIPFRFASEPGGGAMKTGTVFAILALASALFNPVGGILADRANRTVLFISGFAIAGVSLLLLSLSVSLVAITASMVLLGLALGILLTSLMTGFTSTLEKQGMNTGMIYGLFNLAYSLGLFCGPAMALLLSGKGYKESLSYFTFATWAAAALLIALFRAMGNRKIKEVLA